MRIDVMKTYKLFIEMATSLEVNLAEFMKLRILRESS